MLFYTLQGQRQHASNQHLWLKPNTPVNKWGPSLKMGQQENKTVTLVEKEKQQQAGAFYEKKNIIWVILENKV